ncbi:MAG: hypothetical protein GQ538_00910 [Xanthomonadales bacterium]|nr:hypothetical protein [Xanthomonadales bacterium]
MKHYMKAIFSLAVLAFLATASAQAGSAEKMVIALKTDDFELTKTDVGDLAIGESQTIETDSGKVIDILRTADGVELYIDGELLEMDFDGQDLHEEHMVQKHVEIICDDDEECDKNVFVFTGDDNDMSTWISDEGEHVLLHEDIALSCGNDDNETSCSEKIVLISDGEEFDFEELHEMHASGEGHKIIMIKKEVLAED